MGMLLLLGGGYLIYTLVTKYLTGSRLLFASPAVKNVKLTAEPGVSFAIEFPVTNPTPNPLTVEYFNGGAFWGNALLTQLHLLKPVVIAPNGSTTVLVFQANVPFQLVTSEVKNAIVAGDWLRNVFFRGNLVVDGLSIPVNSPLLT